MLGVLSFVTRQAASVRLTLMTNAKESACNCRSGILYFREGGIREGRLILIFIFRGVVILLLEFIGSSTVVYAMSSVRNPVVYNSVGL